MELKDSLGLNERSMESGERRIMKPIFDFPKTSGLCAFCSVREKRMCIVHHEKCRKVQNCGRYDVPESQLLRAAIRTLKY